MSELTRMWINQPSDQQPHHALHGMNVLVTHEPDGTPRVYFLSGEVVSMQMDRLALSEGWRAEGVKRSAFDYTNQAWVVDGAYIRCGHPEEMDCKCFGKLHVGEPAQEGAEIY